MSDRTATRRVWALFAELLEYPRESPVTMLGACRELTSESFPEAEVSLAEFQTFAEGADIGRLQEEYTRAFDLDETHSLYLGYHLLGESYKRSALLVQLQEWYRPYDIEVAGELADHLPVVLRFLSVCENTELSDDILVEAVWPVLDMMAKKDKKTEEATANEDHPPTVPRPYHGLLAALLAVVAKVAAADEKPLVIMGAEGWPAT